MSTTSGSACSTSGAGTAGVGRMSMRDFGGAAALRSAPLGALSGGTSPSAAGLHHNRDHDCNAPRSTASSRSPPPWDVIILHRSRCGRGCRSKAFECTTRPGRSPWRQLVPDCGTPATGRPPLPDQPQGAPSWQTRNDFWSWIMTDRARTALAGAAGGIVRWVTLRAGRTAWLLIVGAPAPLSWPFVSPLIGPLIGDPPRTATATALPPSSSARRHLHRGSADRSDPGSDRPRERRPDAQD